MLKYNQKYLIYDCETNSLNLAKVKPWQIAWSLAEGSRITETFNRYLFWDDLNISKDAARVTGFNIEYYLSIGRQNKTYKVNGKIVHAEPPKKVWDEMKKSLLNEDRIVIGQNLLGFDCYVIASLQKYLSEIPDYSYVSRIYDTRPLGKSYKEGISFPTSGDILSWQYKIMHDRSLKAKSSQLYQLKNLGIEFNENLLHDGLYDIECTFKIFLELKKRMNF